MGIVFLAVDGLNLIRRVYAGTPEGDAHFEDALQACVSSLGRALHEFSPTHAVVVFDGEGPTFRHELYRDYKAGRKPMPEELRAGLHRYRESFSNQGVSSVEREGTEADDVIATLAVGVANHAGRSIILSTDTVYCQLLAEQIHVRDHFEKRELDEEYVRKKFGVAPEQLVDFWALAGSGTTQIPGVPGIGAKTARKLLEEHESLDAILRAAASIPGKPGALLREHAKMAELSRELARLRTDLALGWNLRDFRFGR